MNQNIPAVLYTRLDSRFPYWTGFTSAPGQYTRTGCTVTSIASNVIVSADAAKKPDGTLLNPTARPVEADWYAGGYIQYTRNITGIDGQTFAVTFQVAIVDNTIDSLDTSNSFFTLRYPPPLLSAAPDYSTFIAVAGYDQSINQAVNKFGNFYPVIGDPASDGFVGFPHLPINDYSVTPVQIQGVAA